MGAAVSRVGVSELIQRPNRAILCKFSSLVSFPKFATVCKEGDILSIMTSSAADVPYVSLDPLHDPKSFIFRQKVL